MGNGRTLRIDAPGADGRRQYVGVQVDGQAHAPVWLDWNRLQQGPRVRFALDAKVPEQGWGTAVKDLPVSWCAAPGSQLR